MKEKNKKQKSNIDDLNFGASPEQAEAMADIFFEQIEQKVSKGRAWNFSRFNVACDTPGAEYVQAVLYPNDGQGFVLYARQGYMLHAVTYNRRPVCFRTIEKALVTLADVAHLNPEIVVDLSSWHAEVGPI